MPTGRFGKVYEELLVAHGEDLPSAELTAAVFAMVDKDGSGTVDAMELVSGLAILCDGTEEEKVTAVFNAFDENGDGFVSREEMKKFLACVYKVILTPETMKSMRENGVEVWALN